MSFGIWTPKGNLSFTHAPGTSANPNVIYDTNPQLLGGTHVFKMWAGAANGATGLYYYESADGITSWTGAAGNPILTGTGVAFPTVYKVGSTYYLYHGAFPGGTGINVRTSADGITWGSATLVIPIGTASDWEHVGVAQLNIVPGTSNPYVAYYEGNSAHSALGIATATDPAGPWTKSASNPIIDFAAPPAMQYINGTYYMWLGAAYDATLGAKGYNGLARLSAPSPSGPWTTLKYNGTTQNVIYCSIRADFDYTGTGNQNQGASLNDCQIVTALGNQYLYWTRTTLNGDQRGINMAVATGISPAQQVSGYEGIVNLPHPFPLFSTELNVLATDNFTRANANPIGGNWTPIGTTGVFSANKIVSNFVLPTVLGNNCESYYNALSFPNDHWSQVTPQTINGTSIAQDGPAVRMATGGNEYRVGWLAAAGLGAAGTLTLAGYVATVYDGGLGTLGSFKLSQSDQLTLVASGSNLLVYWQGYPILAATDANLATGAAGITQYAATTLTDSQLNGWSGGGLVAPPALPASGSSAGSLSLRRRKRRDVIS